MKNFLVFITTLLMAMTAKAATTVTVADFSHNPTTYGTFTGTTLFTTKAASGVAGVTITAPASGITLSSSYVNSNYGYCFSITTSAGNTDYQITLAAPSGYIITGYSIGASANSHSYQHTLTAADGTTSSGLIDSYGYKNAFQYFTVTGLNTNSTYFTINTANGGNTLHIAYLTITLKKYETSITSGKYYRLHNAAYSNKAMREVSGVLTTDAPGDNTYSQIWKITSNGSGYSLQNAATGKYIQAATATSQQFQTGSSSVAFYRGTRTVNNLTQFWFSTENSTSSNSYKALHCAAGNNYYVVSWSVSSNDASYWYLEEVTVDEDELAALQAQATLTTGYYQLTNASYPDRSMADGGGVVSTPATVASSYSQIWKLTVSGNTCTLKNALTDKYIQSSPGTSVQYKTGANSYSFNFINKESGGSFLYTFQDPSSTWYGLHCASTQNYYVVGWNYDSDASYWTLSEVEVNETDLQNLKNTLNADYTTQLATYFTDAACTTLKSNYASMTDANLRSAMSALPTDLQDMAVSVKNNTWNSSKGTTWNTYEKDFRIHSYDIFSNSDLWDDITKTGPFAHLFHPTGIQASAGEIIYLFVGSDVADSDASLEAECVAGVDRKGAAYTLHQGYNVIYVPFDCEIFVSYLLNNTNKSCNDYPDITVHIEGGTCNGCFDMRGHNHTNSDWEWLKTNMFSGEYLHVKGNSTMLNCYRERVVSTSTQDVEGIMNVFDFVFDTEQSLSGCDQWKETGRYKMMTNNYDVTSGNPHWSTGAHGYAQPGIWYNGIFNYDNLKNVGTDGGQIWVIEHELGHGHQGPINLSGQTESSNNSLAQCVNFLTTNSARGKQIFTTTRSSRGDGVKAMVSRFNQDGGYSWIDYGGMRTQSGSYNDVWISNKLIFQLWLYFDYMGNYQPTGGNTGFSFMTELYNRMRANGIVKSGSKTSPSPATSDWLKLAKYASEITETDLSEFFEAWGFWKLAPSVSNENDETTNQIWFFGDYSNTYVQTSQTQVDGIKNAMQAYTKKAGNIMFLEDRGTGSSLPTYSGAAASTFGNVGYYETFDEKVTLDYTATVSGTTVTMSGGTGAVGFKVYDGDGNLVAISNTNSFTVTSAVATGINNGTYTVKVAQGDGDDYIAASPNHTATHYEGGVPYIMTDPSQLTSNTLFTMNCARGYVYYDGTQLAGISTATNASKFALVTYNNHTYLYDSTNKAFVCHTKAATAGVTGNSALENNSDFSKIAKDISFGSTNYETYPWYLQEDEFTNWLNMDGTPLVYLNRWTDFENGNGGNTYNVTVVDIDFDPSEAIAMLDAYFNPSATVTYVISDANGVVFTSEALFATIGQTITALPTDLQRAFCTYSTINKTIVAGSNIINVTVTYNLPLTLSSSYASAKWYNMHIRSGKYVFKGNSEPYYPATATEEQKSTDAYQWAFMGNPYAFQVLNKASGAGYTLTKDGSNVVMRSGTYTWTLCQNSDGFILKETGSANNYVNQNGGATGPLQFWNNTNGATDDGSTFRVEEILDNYYALIEAEILPYIYADPTDILNSAPEASIGKPFGISATGANSIVSTYQTQLANQQFSISEYNAVKALFDASILYPEDGKTYLVKNTYNNKYLRVAQHGTRGQVFADLTADEAAQNAMAQISIKVIDSKPYMLTDAHYFNWTYSNADGFEAYTVENADTYDKYAHFVSVSPGIGAFALALGNGEGAYSGYLNQSFYALKNGTTTVAGSTTDYTNEYAQWIFEEFTAVEGDLDGDGDIDITDLNILIDIVFGKKDPANYNNADLNKDNSYGVGDVTKLVNLMRQQNGN